MKKLFLGSLGISLLLQVWSCGDPGTGGSSTDMSVIPDMAMDVTPPVFAGVTSAAAALGQITLDCQEKQVSDGEGWLVFPCCTKCVPSGRKPGRKQGGK